MVESAVKVAVRVRPFNSREKAESAVLCVSMERNKTKIWNKETNYEKEFIFDFSYWSFDGFTEDRETGFLSKDSASSPYADQMTVFNDLGVEVLNNAWEGYHTCLFAYGQTGSGKSYSMVGYGPNKGIVPIVCEEVFRRMGENSNPYIKFDVKLSMLEIYNEQVQDLLAPPQSRVKGGLKVREHPKTGVFVDGLLKADVASFAEIEDAIDRGNKHRTVAATQMNATSSRAHTVITISFTQIFYDQNTGQPLNRKQSDINLVDLAGSERADKTGATGDRLAEGSNINKSLSTLGKVITALSKRAAGELKRNEVVPYRESKLTRILQNALGGNSKTTMIAAISPASFNFDETLSTLRYADAVKSIKNQAIVNETPQEKLIRELREENERLKQLVGKGGLTGPATGGISDDVRLEYEKQIEELKRAKAQAEKTWQQSTTDDGNRLVRVQSLSKHSGELKGPYISNLNEDPMLSGYLKQSIQEGTNLVGKRSPTSQPNITIEGLGIGAEHCQIERRGETCVILPSADPNLKTIVNGQVLTAQKELEHQDRIRFGNHNYCLFVDPDGLSNKDIDWEFAVKEANEEEVKGISQQLEEDRRKEEEKERRLQAELAAAQAQLNEERQRLESMMKDRNRDDKASMKALAEKEREMIARQRAMEEEMRRKEKELAQHESNRLALERLKKQLTQSIQKINEANERAVLLGRNVEFKPELFQDPNAERGIGKGMQNTRIRIRVKYPDLSEDIKIAWSIDKLDERLVDMQEICQQLSYGTAPSEVDVPDPFIEAAGDIAGMRDFQLIGNCYIFLDAIYYMLSIDKDFVPIIDEKGACRGTLQIEVTTQVEGVELSDYDNLTEVQGRQLELSVKVFKASDIPASLCTDVHCSYRLPMLSEDELFTTTKVSSTSQAPEFNYEQRHKLTVTKTVAEELLSHALAISVYGDITQEKRQQEFEKLKDQTKETHRKILVGTATLHDESFEAVTPGTSLAKTPKVKPEPSLPHKGTAKVHTEVLERRLVEQQEAIEREKAEWIRKEEEMMRRVRELEDQNRKSGSTKKGSSCCILQ
jgi:hypothetical protein